MDILKFKIFSKYKNIAHGISTKESSSMKNGDGSRNTKNMNDFLKALKIDEKPVGMKQIHGSSVAIVSENAQPLIDNTDGLITDKKDIALYVLTADCLPILFYDSKKQIIGVAHGGRKGLQSEIIKNILEKFKNEFGSESSDIKVGIGPGIEKKCYEVDRELLDIRKMANDQLLNEGILVENIENVDICTKCRMDEFYSYRGGDGNKRFATILSLR